MEKHREMFGEFIEKGKDLGKTSAEIFKLRVIDKSSDILSNIISWIPIIFMLLLCFLSLNFGIAYLIGQLTKYGDAAGFLFVAAFYLIVGVILLAVRVKSIKEPIMDSIINSLMKDDDEEDEIANAAAKQENAQQNPMDSQVADEPTENADDATATAIDETTTDDTIKEEA